MSHQNRFYREGSYILHAQKNQREQLTVYSFCSLVKDIGPLYKKALSELHPKSWTP